MRPPRRKKLLLVLIWSVVIAALLGLTADALRIKHYRPRSERWDLNAYSLQQSGQGVEVLFLGSSRFREGINATVVEDVIREAGRGETSAYNVAQPNAGVVLSQIMLRDLIASNGCPRLIVLEVSPGGLNHNGHWWPAIADYAEPQDLLSFVPTAESFEQLDFLLASPLRGGVRLYDRIAHPPDPDRVARRLATRGSKFSDSPSARPEGRPGPGNQQIRWARDLYRRRFWRSLDIGGAPVAALDRILALSDGCSAELVLVRMPTLIWVNPRDLETVDGRFVDFMDSFVATNDVSFYDAQADDGRPKRADFRDPVHLDRYGAADFSRHLTSTVLLPALERDP